MDRTARARGLRGQGDPGHHDRVLAAAAALGKGGKATDSQGALETIIHAPFGRVLLGLIALGLVGYAAWRIVDGIADPEGRGTKAKGIALRIGSVGRGVIHLALAYSAVKLALWQQTKESGSTQVEWTAKVMKWPGGVYILWAVAGGLLGYGGWQLYKAFKAKLAKQLDLGSCSSGTRRWLVGISRFGIAARGIVIGTVGILLGRAASHHNPSEAGGTKKSLHELFELGRWPFLAIALGLIAYGVYELVEARYRRIRVE
ncbi:MAG: DUF1206 domain-containing protein [Kofleriaceae bacterium]